jgi:hypothetical protein
MELRRTLGIALVTVAVGAIAATPASAATPATGAVLSDMRTALERYITPVAPEYVDGLQVRRAAIASPDTRFAAAWIEMPYAGRQVAFLKRARAGWRVLDIGPVRVGCGLVPNTVLADFGGKCPQGI